MRPGDRAGGPRLPFARVMVALTGVYVSQTLVSGMTLQAVPTWIRSQGGSLDTVGLLSLAMLPWAFKFLWAPAIERIRLPAGTPARRSRRIVLVGQILLIGLLIAVAFVGDGQPKILLACLVLAAFAASSVDIACDAFAVEQLPPQSRGWGNTAQVGGSYLGAVLGSGLFLIVASRAGWMTAGLAMAAVVLLASLPFWLTREPPRGAQDLRHRPSLGFALHRPEIRRGLVLTLVFGLGAKLCLVLTGPFLIDAGLDPASVGAIVGTAGAGAGIVGTFMGGALVRLAGAPRALLAAAILQALALALFAAIASAGIRGTGTLATVVLLQTLAMAIGFVTLYSLLMDLSSPLQAGVDFTLFQCADALLAALAGFGGGALAERAGFGASFVLAAGLALAAASLVPALLARLPLTSGQGHAG